MTKQELLEFIKEAKELGIKSVEVDGVKIEFNDSKNLPETMKKPEILEQTEMNYKDFISPMSKYDELTDEEILYWSSDYGKELEAEKIAEQQDNKRKAESDDFV